MPLSTHRGIDSMQVTTHSLYVKQFNSKFCPPINRGYSNKVDCNMTVLHTHINVILPS